jgi:kynurenine formamidase
LVSTSAKKYDDKKNDYKECRNIRSRIDTSNNIEYSTEWGKDDVIGALNRLGPHKVADALDTLTHFNTYQLGYVLSPQTRAFGTRVFQSYVFDTTFPDSTNKLSYYDDVLSPAYLGVGSQIDTLAHICQDDRCYNRFRKDRIFEADTTADGITGLADGTPLDSSGLDELGAHNLKSIVTRGVVLDMTKVFDKERLEVGDEITCEKIVDALKLQKIKIKEGDVVLIHTGYSQLINDPVYPTTYPGLDLTGAQFLVDQKVVAIGADTVALEAIPSANNEEMWPGSLFPVHQLLITKNGIYILEVMNTEKLVRAGISDFMFVLGAPRVQGAAQAYINPVAIK